MIMMTPQKFMYALILAGGISENIYKIPGAFTHSDVSKYTHQCRSVLNEIEDLSPEEQASFVKSLAIYEQTVGGLGSATFLARVITLIEDPEHKVFDWVINNTTSYDYFTKGAKSFAELQEIKEAQQVRRHESLRLEAIRAKEAKARRAVKATGNIVNAIRRGDIKAVEALLGHGAQFDQLRDDEVIKVNLAEETGHPEIIEMIKNWKLSI
jgi:hypothetical protein